MMMETTEVIAWAALCLSGYAAWRTTTFNEKQESLIDSQKEVNDMLQEKQREELKSNKKADLNASFIHLKSYNYQLKILNVGKSPATNVQINFPDGNEIIDQSDIDVHFPYESIESNQSVELNAYITYESKRKLKIKLSWKDEYEDNNEKLFNLSIL